MWMERLTKMTDARLMRERDKAWAVNGKLIASHAQLLQKIELLRRGVFLLLDARPYVEHEVEHVGAKADRDLLKAIDEFSKKALRV